MSFTTHTILHCWLDETVTVTLPVYVLIRTITHPHLLMVPDVSFPATVSSDQKVHLLFVIVVFNDIIVFAMQFVRLNRVSASPTKHPLAYALKTYFKTRNNIFLREVIKIM